MFYCKQCSDENRFKNKTHAVEEVVSNLRHLHPELDFNFDENYKTKRDCIKVVCKKHGVFKKRVQKLLAGQGCPKCSVDRLIEEGKLLGGYSERIFEDNPELKKVEGSLY